MWMARYRTSGGNAQEAPVILTNVYGERREPVMDGMWFSNKQMLIDERTTYKTKEIKGAIMADLASDRPSITSVHHH